MSLSKEAFTEDDWDAVQSFDCGSQPYEVEVANWLKGKLGEDSALTAIHQNEPARIWLYRLEDDRLVGFGAMGRSAWRWKRKKDPKVPVTVIIWVAVHQDFQGRPPGPPEGRYGWQILDDLLAEALIDQETHPVLGLCVHPQNVRAIRLYERAGFVGDLDPFRDSTTGVEYRRMALVLNPEALKRTRDAAKK